MNAEQAIAALNEAKAKQAEANAEIRSKLAEQASRIGELEEAARDAELPQALIDAIAAVVEGDKGLANIIPGTPDGGTGA